MAENKGALIVAAGMDCSGKGTIIKGLEEWAIDKGLSCFDLREYEKKHHEFPSLEEVSKHDVILSAEPHYALVGAGLRKEVLQSTKYGAISTAQLFALDREIAYNRLIIPLLEGGKIIFQERHVESSVVYQPIQARLERKIESETSFLEKEVLPLAGNQIALKQKPANAIFVARCTVEEAIRRMELRGDKVDNCRFEVPDFQRLLKERYESKWFKKFFALYGTDVVYVDTSGPNTEVSKQNARAAWEAYLAKGKVPAVLLR